MFQNNGAFGPVTWCHMLMNTMSQIRLDSHQIKAIKS